MFRNTIITALCVLSNTGIIRAEERPDKAWMKYLEGSWTYEVSDGIKGNAVWSFEANGQSMIGRFKVGDSRGVEIGGWQPDTKIVMVNGYTSEGDYWQLEYKHFSDEGGRGAIRGKTRGVGYSGDFEATIVDADRWGWTIEGKTSAGDDLNLSASFRRVKPEPQPTSADRLQPFTYFIGKWRAEESDGEVTDWTFDWGYKENSIENKIVVKNAEGEVTLSNSGFLVWDSDSSRFVNTCVNARGNRVDFWWLKSGDKKWKTWPRGGQPTMNVTIVDENNWTMEWADEIRTYKRQN